MLFILQRAHASVKTHLKYLKELSGLDSLSDLSYLLFVHDATNYSYV